MRNTFLSYLLLAALLIRAAIPVGLMAVDTHDGWYLSICPEGLSREAQKVLVPHQHDDDSDHASTGLYCDLASLMPLAMTAEVSLAETFVVGNHRLLGNPSHSHWLDPLNPALGARAPPFFRSI